MSIEELVIRISRETLARTSFSDDLNFSEESHHNFMEVLNGTVNLLFAACAYLERDKRTSKTFVSSSLTTSDQTLRTTNRYSPVCKKAESERKRRRIFPKLTDTFSRWLFFDARESNIKREKDSRARERPGNYKMRAKGRKFNQTAIRLCVTRGETRTSRLFSR